MRHQPTRVHGNRQPPIRVEIAQTSSHLQAHAGLRRSSVAPNPEVHRPPDQAARPGVPAVTRRFQEEPRPARIRIRDPRTGIRIQVHPHPERIRLQRQLEPVLVFRFQ